MNANLARKLDTASRAIAHRTRGHAQGPITRLMSPGDVGELVKPFVFLDFFEMGPVKMPSMPAHPHSGIATHTTLLRGGIEYADSTGASGKLEAGSVEWMRAGGGVWHWGKPLEGQPTRGYQLWLALPADLENTPPESRYVDASAVESDGNVRLLLGSYGSLRSAVDYPLPLTYLHVRLADSEHFRYQPDPQHDTLWLAVHEGKLHVADATLEGEMAVFEAGNGAIDVRAEGATEFVLGSAAKHPHDLVCGYYSVHTSEAALVRGEAGIRAVAANMKGQLRQVNRGA